MSIEASVSDVRARIAKAAHRAGRSPGDIVLVAISKTAEAPAIIEAFKAGITHFGESRIQEASEKLPALGEIRRHSTWHMVGHLQTNKVKNALQLFDIIGSVDSERLARAISGQAQRTVPVFLEINVGGETNKYGVAVEQAAGLLKSVSALSKLEVRGLMTVAPIYSDPGQARPIFRTLRRLRDELGLKELSMGMSDDFEVAVEEGATLVRIGRAIFSR